MLLRVSLALPGSPKPEVRSYTNTVDMTIPAENITITGIANDNMGISYYGASILCASQMKMRFISALLMRLHLQPSRIRLTSSLRSSSLLML